MPTTLTARWLCPIGRPALANGLLTFVGDRILAIEPAGTRRAAIDLGEVVVLPGLVNAHTHLDLTGMAGLAPPSPDFPAWLRQVVAYRRQRSADQVRADIRLGSEACLRSGTTLVGDISADGSSWDILANGPLRAVVFRELLGLTSERAANALRLAGDWLANRTPTVHCRPALSPHAPYSVRRDLFDQTTRLAAQYRCPLAVHLAETAFEEQLLCDHTGPLATFLQSLGVWDSEGLVSGFAEVLHREIPDVPRLLIHGNYLPDDLDIPTGTTIVYCPRTHAAFGHSPHPWRKWLARGVPVAFGTDSLASNPDLSLLAEIRFLHRLAPEVSPVELVSLATLGGANALGLGDQAGSLEPGKWADFIAVRLQQPSTTDPLEDLLSSQAEPEAVFVGGRQVVGGQSS